MGRFDYRSQPAHIPIHSYSSVYTNIINSQFLGPVTDTPGGGGDGCVTKQRRYSNPHLVHYYARLSARAFRTTRPRLRITESALITQSSVSTRLPCGARWAARRPGCRRPAGVTPEGDWPDWRAAPEKRHTRHTRLQYEPVRLSTMLLGFTTRNIMGCQSTDNRKI